MKILNNFLTGVPGPSLAAPGSRDTQLTLCIKTRVTGMGPRENAEQESQVDSARCPPPGSPWPTAFSAPTAAPSTQEAGTCSDEGTWPGVQQAHGSKHQELPQQAQGLAWAPCPATLGAPGPGCTLRCKA